MLWFLICQFVLFFLLFKFGDGTEVPLFSAKIHFFRETIAKIIFWGKYFVNR